MVVVLVSEPFQETSTTTTTTLRQEFARVVSPLERSCGRRLGNPQRQVCLDAFTRHPEGVAAVARAALADAERNPLGLFFYRIRNGWHELEPVDNPLERFEPPAKPNMKYGRRAVSAREARMFAEEIRRRRALAEQLREHAKQKALEPGDDVDGIGF